MVSGYDVPHTLDGGPVKLSLAGSAWWRRREMRTGTREKAVVRPVSLFSSRTETWRKLPGSLARLCARFLVSWVCGRPWPLAFWSGSVCGSGPVVCSWFCCAVWFRPPGLFQKEATTQGTQRPGFPTMVVGNEGRRLEDRSFDRYPLLRMGSIRLVRYDSGIGRGVLGTFARLFKPTGGGRWKNLLV